MENYFAAFKAIIITVEFLAVSKASLRLESSCCCSRLHKIVPLIQQYFFFQFVKLCLGAVVNEIFADRES
jgi:hypothetical protein